MKNQLAQRLAAGETLIGGWLSNASPGTAEIMATCEFDWIAVDLEHSTADVDISAQIFIACERHGVAPVARLPSADTDLARRLLDCGAQGLIVSTVESAEAFAEFASYCHYPPRGRRGVGLSRVNRWGADFEIYLRDFEPVLIPQIETARGIEASGAIAALADVSALFVGPYDLSASLGNAGNFETPEFAAALETFGAACRDNGKAAGFHQVAPEPDQLKAKMAAGYRMLAYGTDATAIRHTFAGLVSLKAP